MAQFGEYMQVPQVDNLKQDMAAEPEELTEEVFDIPSDAYGGFILALIRDVPILTNEGIKGPNGLIPAYNVFFGVGLLVLNNQMQFALLGYVNNFVVNSDMYTVQQNFAKLRQSVFIDGIFQIDLWNDYDPLAKQYMCAMGMTNAVFYYCCIFCWTLTVMIEVRTNINFAFDVFRMPRCYTGAEQIVMHTADGHSSESVAALTICTKQILYGAIVIPKFAICSWLLWIGCNWLSASKSMESLVMNCVAMAFVVESDEMLFNAVLPKSFREEVEALDFLIRTPTRSHRVVERDKIKAYNTSIIFLFAACVFVYSYTFYLQAVLPIAVLQLEGLCGPYLEEKYSEICDSWGLALNGMDVMSVCYPTPASGIGE